MFGANAACSRWLPASALLFDKVNPTLSSRIAMIRNLVDGNVVLNIVCSSSHIRRTWKAFLSTEKQLPAVARNWLLPSTRTAEFGTFRRDLGCARRNCGCASVHARAKCALSTVQCSLTSLMRKLTINTPLQCYIYTYIKSKLKKFSINLMLIANTVNLL